MMDTVCSTIEAILFVASRPLSAADIARRSNTDVSVVEEAIALLISKKNTPESGVWVMQAGDTYTLASAPHAAESVAGFLRDEAAGELTKAQLETLTVIAYKGPITRSELEELRGVNCAIILRILLLRDLIGQEDGPLEPLYSVSVTALAHMGIVSVSALPEYDVLHSGSHTVREDATGAVPSVTDTQQKMVEDDI
jgi:segregation and condensation protein B